MREWLIQLVKWSMRMVIHSFLPDRRFVLLCPNFMRRQFVYDRQNKSFLGITIRDQVDYKVLEQVYLYEEYELRRLARYGELMEIYESICSENKVPLILDLGAHAGLASKYFSRQFPKANIVAVEPDPDNIAAARVNLQREANVRIINGGVSHQRGKARLLDSPSGSWGCRTERHEQGHIDLHSVNSIIEMEAAHTCVPFIAKIDIEGFEKDLFLTNTEWIDRFPLIMIELHDWLFPREGTSSNFLKCMARHDRDFVYADENIFSIKNMDSNLVHASTHI
jgi:FkbM family methyltransferase